MSDTVIRPARPEWGTAWRTCLDRRDRCCPPWCFPYVPAGHRDCAPPGHRPPETLVDDLDYLRARRAP